MSGPPRFADAFGGLLRAAGFLLRSPRLWAAAAVPAAIVVVLSGVLIWLSFDRLAPWVGQLLLPDVQSSYARGLRTALGWLAALLATYVAYLLALVVAPPLSAPALEHLVRARERALGVPEHPEQGFWSELRLGFAAQLWVLARALPLLFVLWLIGLALPLLWVPLLACKILIIAITVAWNLLDYPLSLRGMPAAERWRLLRQHWPPIVAFGLCFAGLSWIPLAGVGLLPIGVLAATELVSKMLFGSTGSTPAANTGPLAHVSGGGR